MASDVAGHLARALRRGVALVMGVLRACRVLGPAPSAAGRRPGLQGRQGRSRRRGHGSPRCGLRRGPARRRLHAARGHRSAVLERVRRVALPGFVGRMCIRPVQLPMRSVPPWLPRQPDGHPLRELVQPVHGVLRQRVAVLRSNHGRRGVRAVLPVQRALPDGLRLPLPRCPVALSPGLVVRTGELGPRDGAARWHVRLLVAPRPHASRSRVCHRLPDREPVRLQRVLWYPHALCPRRRRGSVLRGRMARAVGRCGHRQRSRGRRPVGLSAVEVLRGPGAAPLGSGRSAAGTPGSARPRACWRRGPPSR